MNVRNGTDINVKRLYLDGVGFEEPCPNCHKPHAVDLGESCLSHPQVGVPEEVFFYCEDCDIEYDIDVVLNITVNRV